MFCSYNGLTLVIVKFDQSNRNRITGKFDKNKCDLNFDSTVTKPN